MHHLSMMQALRIWSEFEAAYYGKNGFGGDTAEIYAYRLMPSCPVYDQGLAYLGTEKDGGLLAATAREEMKKAATSLRALVGAFEELHDDAVILVETGDGWANAKAWLADNIFSHRVHLRVKGKAA